ncbi:hypothetical protein WG908_10965 [Sphingobium sp. AN641]|uniref:hypothetical protein n=1 Tax=Sphingobium sp. AN641 TaxID=3133443 RepID=UPI0030BAC069
MIDAFTLLLSHGVILLAAWRLSWRPDLDRDPPGDGDGADMRANANSADSRHA